MSSNAHFTFNQSTTHMKTMEAIFGGILLVITMSVLSTTIDRNWYLNAPILSSNAKAATYLNVSFADKNKAKAKGTKWEAAKKQWYAPHGVDINVFKLWWPDLLK